MYRRHFKLPPEAREQHVFVDFEGAMMASVVWINGRRLGEYKGGYTPFSFELTPHLDLDRENVLAVELDSSERADIPPCGGSIDYLTFGGIYREVALRVVPAFHLENIFARPKDVLTNRPTVDVSCFVAHLEPRRTQLTLEVELLNRDRVLARARNKVQLPSPAPTNNAVSLIAESDPDRANFGNLPHPPFHVEFKRVPWGDLRIEGYLAGKKVIEKRLSSKGIDQQFIVSPDDRSLVADGADTTRVTLKVTDEFGAPRPYSTASIVFAVDGPVELIGDNPFSLVGGCGAIWLRARRETGTVVFKATHPVLGTRAVELQIMPAEAERV